MSEPDPRAYLPPTHEPAPGNDVKILRDGREAFPAMLAAIAEATRSVHLEMYIFEADGTGRRFAEELAAAAGRGVEVALLYDSLGSWRTPPFVFDWLAAHGAMVLGYRPLAPWRRGWGWGLRDHRKILACDGAVAFTGGVNVSDAWAPEEAGGEGWRDTMVRIEGAAAGALDGLFREVWEREARRQRRSLPLAPPRPAPSAARGAPVAIVATGGHARRRSIRKSYRWAIERARRYIYLANPYFVPDRSVLRSLEGARRRGVRVVLILPGKSDQPAVQWAARATYERLLARGVEIHHWCRRVFHAKTAVVDGAWCTVGTYNLDTQSLRYNLEVTAVIPDRGVAGSLERTFLEDLASCERVDPGRWRARPLWWRVPERLFYLLRAWL